MSEIEKRLMTHCGNDECDPCVRCCLLLREAADEIERLQAIVDRLPKTPEACQ